MGRDAARIRQTRPVMPTGTPTSPGSPTRAPAGTTADGSTPGRPGRRTLRLRPWQRTALDAYQTTERSDFLAVATPGAGKTTFALTAARLSLAPPAADASWWWPPPGTSSSSGRRRPSSSASTSTPNGRRPTASRLTSTASSPPTSRWRRRPTRSAPSWPAVWPSSTRCTTPATTWPGATASPGPSSRRPGAWPCPAPRSAATPPPSRSSATCGYQVVPDFEYGYAEALADGRVVRPVYFPRFGGHMEWMAPDGAELAATFDDPLPRSLANQRLRAALSLDGEWLPAVLAPRQHPAPGHPGHPARRRRARHRHRPGPRPGHRRASCATGSASGPRWR